MKCPFCGDQESKVVDSRHSEDGLSIRRRRECMGCQRRFTTYEIVESLPIIVVKRDGSRQNFDRNKILNSMIRAFDKRKVDVTDLDRITTEIEQTIQNTLEREISTDKIGEMVMERLKPLLRQNGKRLFISSGVPGELRALRESQPELAGQIDAAERILDTVRALL